MKAFLKQISSQQAPLPPPPDRPQIEISKQHLRHNINTIRSILPNNTKICAVLKANGYGLGDQLLASLYTEKQANFQPIDTFLVSSFWEAQRLRLQGFHQPLFALDCPLESIAECVQHKIEVILHSKHQLEKLCTQIPSGHKMKVQINFNSGMSRLDCHFDEAFELAIRANRAKNLELTGIMSHLNCADNADQDLVSQSQIAAFETLLLALSRKGINPKYTHILNSSGICRFNQGVTSMVRAGIGLLGCQPHVSSSPPSHSTELKGALSFHAPIRQVLKIESEQPLGYNRIKAPKGVKSVAIVQMGYADGLPRIPTKEAALHIQGHLCPVIVHTCMDFCFVDVTELTNKQPLQVGTRAFLFSSEPLDHGSHTPLDGSLITMQEACKRWQVRPYEWLVHLSERTKRQVV